MLKALVSLSLIGSSLSLFAEDLSSSLAGGSQEFEYTRYTDQYIQLRIHEMAKVNCKKGLCTLFSQTTNGQGFAVEFSIGENANGGGYYGNGSGPIVVVPGQATSNQVRPYVGLTVRYNWATCTQKINVPESLYISMNTYLYNLINEDGTPQRGFTPADEAMILFYSTIMKQATGCKQ